MEEWLRLNTIMRARLREAPVDLHRVVRIRVPVYEVSARGPE